ncbi:Ku protein, partial [Stenotrophomonas maltophilia]|uniref:Ku protein n=1 Tax=Stenotrophomonas maltophilia TaxID=40324 RepID=UPI0023B86913
PYYLGPVGPFSADGYSVIREAMKGRNVGALARAILFKRIRTVLIRPDGDGLIAHTLHFDYEVRSAATAFEDIPPLALPAEMLD